MSEITILDEIKNAVDSTDVLLFMKGSPQFPQCGFSSTVCQILNQLGIDFKSVDVLQNAEVRDGIKQFSSWPTIPQLYVKGEFLGGCDIVREMYESGELADFLTGKGVAVST
ncbi:MAG: Grx4 family monothiol glutaredoxin [Pseudomonadota bacterium]